jgi:hypothetical protein
MKTKIFLFAFLLTLICLEGCEDVVDNIGMNMKPREDNIVVFDTTITVKGEAVKIDSIYVKSINGLLGRFYDSRYGEIEGGYMCQYYPSAGFDLDSITGERGYEVDSMRLNILYTTFFGDSLTPMEATVYPVINQLTKSYYNNIDPAQYCDLNAPLGRMAYTIRNMNISDSANNASAYKLVSIPLPREFGQRFLEEYRKQDHGAYASVTAMANFFPGTYVASTFGKGCLIEVASTEIDIYYTRSYTTKTYDGSKDSIYVGIDASVLNVTKEIIQLNRYKNGYDAPLEKENSDTMYLKTPGGIFSKITIPIRDIKETIGSKKFSSVKLSIAAYPKEDKEYVWDFPGMGTQNTVALTRSKLLLIPQNEIISFFENQKNADNQTTFYTTFNTSTYSYTFDNISNVVQKAIDENPQRDLELFLIPVDVSYYLYTDSYSYSTTAVDYACAHYLRPSAVALKKGNDDLKIQIIAADLEVNGK